MLSTFHVLYLYFCCSLLRAFIFVLVDASQEFRILNFLCYAYLDGGAVVFAQLLIPIIWTQSNNSISIE